MTNSSGKTITQNLFTFSLLLLLFSCGNEAPKQQAAGPKNLQVEGFKVNSMPFNNELSVTAELLAKEQVSIKAPMSGQVLNIFFEEGKKITKGQPIIHIDDRVWKAQLLGLNAELDAANKDYERKQALLEIEGSTQEEIDNAFSTIEILKSQIQQLQINIDLANVVAPFSGWLGMRDFSTGAFLKEGDVITTLTDINQLKVDFSLPQMYKNSLALGKNVFVEVDNDTLKATVYAINPLVDAQSRRLNVRALLNQPTGKPIMPGSFAEVIISTNFIKDALLIPSQAIVTSINDQTVYVYKNGKAVRKIIQMGDRTADKVHVLDGLEVGDTIITTGLLQIKEGMEVTLQSTI